MNYAAHAIAVFIILIVYYLLKRKKPKIAIVGLSGAGKTRYFHSKFKNFQDVQYTTSLKINSGEVDNIEWIDVPGNEKLFQACWDNIKHDLASVNFLIDAVGFYKERRQVAKRLDYISKDFRIEIILVKIQDNRALEKEKIELLLEKELKEIREIRRKNVGVDQDFIEEHHVDFYFRDEKL